MTRRRPGFASRRHVWRPAPGLMRLDQLTVCAGSGTGLDVTGPCWIVAVVSVLRGELEYIRGRDWIAAPGRRFAIAIPPFSVVQCRLRGAVVRSTAIAGRAPWPAGAPVDPVAFHPAPAALPATPDAVAFALGGARTRVAVARAVDPSPLSRRLKALIDRGFHDLAPLQVLAGRLRTSPAVASRYFRRDYGIPPATYRHAVRVMDGLLRLVNGEPVAEVASAVGFGELSQFYRHFNALACGTPGRYRRGSRIAKIG